jgi:hypothetical protein
VLAENAIPLSRAASVLTGTRRGLTVVERPGQTVSKGLGAMNRLQFQRDPSETGRSRCLGTAHAGHARDKRV